MLDTTGTRPLSWYADQSPDFLDGEEREMDDREDALEREHEFRKEMARDEK